MDHKIQQFIAVTGSTSQVARNMLEACDGNLDMAINMHLECGGGETSASVGGATASTSGVKQGVSTAGLSSHDSSSMQDNRSYEEIHGVRAPIPQTQGVLIEQELQARPTFHRRHLPRSVFDPFQDFSSGSTHGGPGDSDKKRSLAQLFKPPTELMFHGTFQEARRAGQLRKKWVMVNLQDSSVFQCCTLNRDLWSDVRVSTMVQEKFIFLQIQRIADEAVKFRQLYECDTYPAIVIIDPRTGEKMSEWGYLTVSEFLDKVGEFLAVYKLDNSFANNHDAKHQSTVYDQSEDAQLEAAIRASLEQQQSQPSQSVCDLTDSDNEDTISLPSDDESEDKEDQEVADNVHRPRSSVCIGEPSDGSRTGRKRLSSSTDGGAAAAKIVKLEGVDSRTLSESGGDEELVYLLIRFPNGKRIEKSFPANHTLQVLFQYLREEGISMKDHEVVTTFPRRSLSTLPRSQTFKQAGLCPRQTVYVQLID